MKIGNIPLNLPVDIQKRLTEMKAIIETLQPNDTPPDTPTNVVVTPISGGNQITFTRSHNAEGYLLRVSATPSWKADSGLQRDLGDSNIAEDFTGMGGIVRYYQIVAYKKPLLSKPTAPVAATSLNLGTNATLPTPPVSAPSLATSTETGLPVAIQPRGTAKLKQ